MSDDIDVRDPKWSYGVGHDRRPILLCPDCARQDDFTRAGPRGSKVKSKCGKCGRRP